MKTFTIDGYAHWASFVINGDGSALDAADREQLAAWVKGNDIRPCDAVSCSDETFFGTPDGGDFLQGECATYTFFERGE